MKKTLWLIAVFTMLLSGAKKPYFDTIRLTIINKAGMDIAVQLVAIPKACVNIADVCKGEFYYFPVPEGKDNAPSIKYFDVEKNTYSMQLFYIETYDPVYGYKCDSTIPNALIASNNIRLVVLPCTITPVNVGEPGYRKYLPSPIKEKFFYDKYWISRLVY